MTDDETIRDNEAYAAQAEQRMNRPAVTFIDRHGDRWDWSGLTNTHGDNCARQRDGYALNFGRLLAEYGVEREGGEMILWATHDQGR